MRNTLNARDGAADSLRQKDDPIADLDSRLNQTFESVQGLLKGRSFPGKILLSRRSEPFDHSGIYGSPQAYARSLSQNDAGSSRQTFMACGIIELSFATYCFLAQEQHQRSSFNASDRYESKSKPSVSTTSKSEESQKTVVGARVTDSARMMKFKKELSTPIVTLEKLRELAWSGVPPHMRPNVWRLLLIAVDCPRTVPDVTFFQQAAVQKSLERILYTWFVVILISVMAIRHPASGYVQGINDLVTPFLVVFLSEHLEGSIDSWLALNISNEKIANVEADCYWCLSKLLDGMQDHYTFAQPGIQRLVFKLKELVRRIDEPVSMHMEEQGLEYLQFAFRWFNCLLIREIPFQLVTRLWDTYLAEGDALPDFLVYIAASLLLTWSDKIQKLDFPGIVMFLQHLPTHNWADQELEMVLSRAFMWHTMFNSAPSHLAS
ncbi:hypothetical protein Cgig2_024457 [Carnegiea gigantea]|uniref:Rab-GAP TBC domain-containing protein n=1 Tax=Carnegiea gigantea TaxID=171969 RepID=A0A9Q1KM36_9CARY|nr:hypothetical protein Cgig2_024457 [Carnegiea gigantea]